MKPSILFVATDTKTVSRILELEAGAIEFRPLNELPRVKGAKLPVFNFNEGRTAAGRILDEGFDRHVLIGYASAVCFGLNGVPYLEEKLAHNLKHNKPQRFLVFPPLEGVWWDEPFNRYRARKRLREFLTP